MYAYVFPTTDNLFRLCEEQEHKWQTTSVWGVWSIRYGNMYYVSAAHIISAFHIRAHKYNLVL